MVSSASIRALPVCLGMTVMMALSAASAEAATMTLRWDPNPEATIAGYIVSSGTRSGYYTQTADVGTQTSLVFQAPTPPVVYYFVVRAYDTSGLQSAPSVEVNTGVSPTPLTLTSLSASLTAPQVVETPITFQAVATGGIMPYQYKWLVSDGTNWSAVTGWLTTNTFSWRPTTANANYRVGVWVRSATSTEDAPDNPSAGSSVPFSILGATDTMLTLSANKAAPQAVRTRIQFAAEVAGAATYRYKWWVFDGLSWSITQEWSSDNTFRWTPTSPNASYQVLARVQNVADPADTAGASMVFPIVESKSGASNGR